MTLGDITSCGFPFLTHSMNVFACTFNYQSDQLLFFYPPRLPNIANFKTARGPGPLRNSHTFIACVVSS